MERVVILGGVATGKSTLARELGERLDLPVIHLDALFYLPGWVPSERSAFRKRVSGAIAGDRWVTDGNFIADTGALRLTRANTIIWLEQTLGICLARAISRILVDGRRRPRPDLASGCRDRLNFALVRDILSFNRVGRPRIETALRQWAPDKPVIRLTGDLAIAAFLGSISAQSVKLPATAASRPSSAMSRSTPGSVG
jgi:adenylate kinase family enzyme